MPRDPDLERDHDEPAAPALPEVMQARVESATATGRLTVTVQDLDGGAQARAVFGSFPAAKAGDVAWVRFLGTHSDDLIAVGWDPVGVLPSWPTSKPL